MLYDSIQWWVHEPMHMCIFGETCTFNGTTLNAGTSPSTVHIRCTCTCWYIPSMYSVQYIYIGTLILRPSVPTEPNNYYWIWPQLTLTSFQICMYRQRTFRLRKTNLNPSYQVSYQFDNVHTWTQLNLTQTNKSVGIQIVGIGTNSKINLFIVNLYSVEFVLRTVGMISRVKNLCTRT